MKLERKRTRAAILPLFRRALLGACLGSLLASVGCGGDSDPEESAPPASATASDADAGHPDGSAVSHADGAAESAVQDSASTAPDSSDPFGDDDLDEPAQAPGNSLYTEGPACKAPGLGRVGGSVEGVAVAFDLSSLGRSDDFSLDSEGSDVTQRLELSWKPRAVPGELSDVTEGFIELPHTYASGDYCLTEGKVLRDPTITDDDIGDRYFIHITKVQKREADGTCVGDDLAADLKICEHG